MHSGKTILARTSAWPDKIMALLRAGNPTGAIDDLSAPGTNDLDRQIAALTASSQVDTELARLRGEIDAPAAPAEIESGDAAPQAEPERTISILHEALRSTVLTIAQCNSAMWSPADRVLAREQVDCALRGPAGELLPALIG